MTPQQHKLFSFIRDRIDATGVCPTYAEMGEAIGQQSKSGPHRIVDALVADGYLMRGRAKTERSLRLPDYQLRVVPTSALIAEIERRGIALAGAASRNG